MHNLLSTIFGSVCIYFQSCKHQTELSSTISINNVEYSEIDRIPIVKEKERRPWS